MKAAVISAFLLVSCAADTAEPEGFQGVVELDETVVAFEVPGRLETVAIDEGAVVEAGATLATLDTSLQEIARAARVAELRIAEARLRLVQAGPRAEEVRGAAAELRAAREALDVAQRDLQRANHLTETGAVSVSASDRLRGEVAASRGRVDALSQQLRALRRGSRTEEIEMSEAQVEAARLAVQAAEETLERHALSAPIAGTVLDVHVEPGELVGVGTPVATLGNLDSPFVDVFVPEDRIEEARLNAEVEVEVDSPDTTFEGRIEWIGRSLEFTPRFLFSERERPNLVLRVRVRISDPEHRLHAGVPARARFP